jgi:hypothetical protein
MRQPGCAMVERAGALRLLGDNAICGRRPTLGKLLVARLHHLAEPNDGTLARTARQIQHAWAYALEAAVNAPKAVTVFLAIR